MNVHLPVGRGTIPVDVPDNWINGRCYRAHRFNQANDERAELSAAVNLPVGMESVDDALHGGECVVVVDSSAPGLFPKLLPAVLEEIQGYSIMGGATIRILLTNTIWNPMRLNEAERLIPSSLRSQFEVILHDPFDPHMSADAGALDSQINLRLNEHYLEADTKILLGPVRPDLIMGFSGGRALILPGLADETTARALFSYSRVGQPTVRYGEFINNPYHVAASKAQVAAGCDLAICALLSPEGAVSEVVLGHPGQAYLAAVKKVTDKMKVTVKEPMDIVVTCGGGSPHDATLVRVIEAMAAAIPILRGDGTIVLAADLSGGFGPDPLREILMKSNGPRGFNDRYSRPEKFKPGQWIIQRYFEILQNHEVIIFSQGMPEDDL
ncbi:DUF2088 domain-containing protein, partial [Candidatus Poribacteria bacterium]|nr:DUF2088 domain-containing protein [Candidatus Poribacteria bacterium]